MSMRKLPAFFGCAATMIFVANGCGTSPERCGNPTQTVVWREEGSGEHANSCLAYYATYLAWPDGGSLAFVVPCKRGPKHAKAGGNEKEPSQSVFIAAEEGVIYHNTSKLLTFPSRDNRCYVLGRDLELHDTGRSAEWFRWSIGAFGNETRTPWGADIRFVHERPGLDEPGEVVGSRIPACLELERQKRAFWREIPKWAFDGMVMYCPPHLRCDANGRLSERIGTTNQRTEIEQRWIEKYLDDMPKGWKSAYPRDNWRQFQELRPTGPAL